MSTDYRPTLFLPRTSFGMKANLRELEPRVLERWRKMDLFHRLREQSQGRAKFVLHDGPPYANGHLHIGHALNKILKDVINRSQQMTSKDANYVPGWDCHGLPIEWKVEERYRESGKNKDEVPIVDFRQECREFAEHWIDVQSAEFQRLGVVGDWDNPYTTMTYAAEAHIVGELGKFLMNGALYRGAMAVMWSPVEKTALAEAEVEYKDHTSTTVHVRFPVVRASRPSLEGAAILIWTTTPWTIPGNRAVAYGGDIDYVVLEVESAAEGSLARVGERLILAEPLVEAVCHVAGITGHAVRDRFKGAALAGTTCAHPLAGMGYDSEGPALAAPFATSEEGTGIVHIAAGPRRRRLALGPGTRPGGSPHGGRGWHVLSPCAPVRGQARVPGQRRDCPDAARQRSPSGPGQAGPSLSAQLAFEGALDLPQRRAVVHFHGDDGTAGNGAEGHRRHPIRSRLGPQSTAGHDRDPARLVRLSTTGLGRADRRLHGQAHGRAPARPGGPRPHRRRRGPGGRGCLVHVRFVALPGQRP